MVSASYLGTGIFRAARPAAGFAKKLSRSLLSGEVSSEFEQGI